MEVVVALTIIAAVSVLVFRAVSGVGRGADAAAGQLFAVERARALLAYADAAPRLADGIDLAGPAGEFGWRATVALIGAAGQGGPGEFGLFRITVTVSWGRPARTVALTTWRMAPIAPPGSLILTGS